MYRNKICTLTRINKQQYFTKNMGKNKNSIVACKSNNSKPISFIKDPDDDNSISSNPNRIGNTLNDNFASVGPKLANKVK